MPDSVVCEYCGKAVQQRDALVESVEQWPRYFCSEACKIIWGEEALLEEDEDA